MKSTMLNMALVAVILLVLALVTKLQKSVTVAGIKMFMEELNASNESPCKLPNEQSPEVSYNSVNTSYNDKLGKSFYTTNISALRATICAVAKNEERYIDEWLQYHRFLGFDHVRIHDNAANASTYMASLPAKYGNFVSVTHSPGLGLQAISYAKCVKEGANSSTWAAFIDVDEFIVLRKHANIKAFLQDVAPNGGSVVLNWSIMGSNGSMEYDPAPVVTRFTLTSNAPNIYVKAIAFLPHVRVPHVHYCHMKPGHPTVDQHGRILQDGPSLNPNNDREIATLNHYQTKSWEEFTLKRRRGFAFSYKSNYIYDSATANATAAMIKNYNIINNLTNPVVDTTARDFYLKHCRQSSECKI